MAQEMEESDQETEVIQRLSQILMCGTFLESFEIGFRCFLTDPKFIISGDTLNLDDQIHTIWQIHGCCTQNDLSTLEQAVN